MNCTDKVMAELRMVDPDLAFNYLVDCEFKGQRRIRQQHVMFLAEIMQRGHFREGSEISFGMLKGRRYLLNGQHTLSAIVEVGKPQLLNVMTYFCNSEDEMRGIYTRFDRGLTRSAADAISPYQLQAKAGLRNNTYRRFYGSSGVASCGFTPIYRTYMHPTARVGRVYAHFRDAEIRASLMASWTVEAENYDVAISGTAPKAFNMLLRTGVFSVALVTFRYAGERAMDFWAGIAQDDGLRQGDPRKTLLTYLYANPANRQPEYLYAQYVAVAWNAFVKGEERSILRIRQQYEPITILESPHSEADHMLYLNSRGEVLKDPISLRELEQDYERLNPHP